MEGPVKSLGVKTSGRAEVQRAVFPKAKSSKSIQASAQSFSPALWSEVLHSVFSSGPIVFFEREKPELDLDQSTGRSLKSKLTTKK